VTRPSVAVVGGGIAGLAAAWELVEGPPADGGTRPDVHVFEESDRVGGKLQAAEFAGRTVDLAADAFLGRRPEATDLCDELGIAGSLVPVGAAGASIWARGRLRPMPSGLNLGVPTRWWPLARSGILGPLESLRPALDLVTPHRRTAGAFGDRAVGPIVEERLGRPVVERLVDPLVGGINAGAVDQLSAAATFPVLIGASHQPGSLMRSLARAAARAAQAAPAPAGAPSPVFWSLPEGTASLATLLAEALTRRGVTIHTGTAVEAIERAEASGGSDPGWRLTLAGRGPGRASDQGEVPVRGEVPAALTVDGLILAVPAPRAAVLLALPAPEAAGLLSTVGYASVSVVTLALPAGSLGTTLRGTGFLVPRTSTVEGRPALVTGVTYLGRKWPHLGRPEDELVRASVGRAGDLRHTGLDDDELVASVVGELSGLAGLRERPVEARVTRWEGAFPQYEVGHLLRVGQVEQSLAALRTVAVAGAALRGVGIPACIGSGRSAARQVLAGLGSGAPDRTR
jgi:oxygen-dependent protoporphyrinogen oxidase